MLRQVIYHKISTLHPLNSNTPQSQPTVQIIEVTTAQVNQRVDNFLIKLFKNVPRTRIYRIIRKGEVRVNKKRIKPEYKLQIGDVLRIPPVRVDQKPEAGSAITDRYLHELEASILYENKNLIIINKPAGLAVHSGSGVDFGVIDIMRKLRVDCDMELAHRLDRDTSGCLLLAKHRQSLLAMQTCIKENTLTKFYSALVKGKWPNELTEVKHSLRKKHLPNGERRVYVEPTGQQALTRIVNVETGHGCSLITVQLITGRTHQIRVHCQAEGHEIVGDNKYGDSQFNREMRRKGIKRLMLHASRLELPNTDFSHELVINAPLPSEFKA